MQSMCSLCEDALVLLENHLARADLSLPPPSSPPLPPPPPLHDRSPSVLHLPLSSLHCILSLLLLSLFLCICSLPPFLSSCLVPLPPTSFTFPRLPPTLPPPLPAPLLLTPSSPFLILPAPTSFCSALSLLHHVEHTHSPPLLSCFSPPPPPSIITHSLSTSPLSLFLSHLFQLSILLLSFSPSPCPPSFLLFLLPLF